MDSHAHALTVGQRSWLLLPDRQALWAWRESGRPLPTDVWLGFPPRVGDRRALIAAGARQVWLSGPPPSRGGLPRRWRASGASGFLLAEGA
jgi:competence protein ComEC